MWLQYLHLDIHMFAASAGWQRPLQGARDRTAPDLNQEVRACFLLRKNSGLSKHKIARLQEWRVT